MDDSFAKETLGFVNINFIKYPLNFNNFMKKHLNFGKTKKTPEL